MAACLASVFAVAAGAIALVSHLREQARNRQLTSAGPVLARLPGMRRWGVGTGGKQAIRVAEVCW
jgi:hypothetical protein